MLQRGVIERFWTRIVFQALGFAGAGSDEIEELLCVWDRSSLCVHAFYYYSLVCVFLHLGSGI